MYTSVKPINKSIIQLAFHFPSSSLPDRVIDNYSLVTEKAFAEFVVYISVEHFSLCVA